MTCPTSSPSLDQPPLYYGNAIVHLQVSCIIPQYTATMSPTSEVPRYRPNLLEYVTALSNATQQPNTDYIATQRWADGDWQHV